MYTLDRFFFKQKFFPLEEIWLVQNDSRSVVKHISLLCYTAPYWPHHVDASVEGKYCTVQEPLCVSSPQYH